MRKRKKASQKKEVKKEKRRKGIEEKKEVGCACATHPMQVTADEQEAVDSLVGLGKERSQNNESYTVNAYIAAKYGEGKKARWHVVKVLEIDDEQEEVYI